MSQIVKDVLVKHYQNLLNRAIHFDTPDSLRKPNSNYIGKQQAISDLNSVAKINSIINALGINESPIDITSYMMRISKIRPSVEYTYTDSYDIKKIDGKFQRIEIPNGRKIALQRDSKTELVRILIELNNELQMKIGKIISYIEKKISELRPTIRV